MSAVTIIGVVEHKYDARRSITLQRTRPSRAPGPSGVGASLNCFKKCEEPRARRGAARVWERLSAYFSPLPCAAVRRASSSERRMSIAIVASFLPPPAFLDLLDDAHVGVAESVGRFTDVVAVGLSPFTP